MTIGEIMQDWSAIGPTLFSVLFFGFFVGLVTMAWLDDRGEKRRLLENQ